MLGIETTNGEATGVVTGSRVVAANAVLCAAGIGSADLARTIGISLPIQIVRASVAQTKATRVTMQTAAWAPHVAFRPKGGSLLVEASLLTVAVVHNSVDISRSFTNPGIQATARGPRRSPDHRVGRAHGKRDVSVADGNLLLGGGFAESAHGGDVECGSQPASVIATDRAFKEWRKSG